MKLPGYGQTSHSQCDLQNRRNNCDCEKFETIFFLPKNQILTKIEYARNFQKALLLRAQPFGFLRPISIFIRHSIHDATNAKKQNKSNNMINKHVCRMEC